MQQKNLLIDGDFILWKTVPNRVLTETEKMYEVKSEKTLKETYELIDWYINEKILIPTKAIGYIAFLGGKGNFRKDQSIEYKGDRIDKEFPQYFKECKQYLVDKWNFNIVNNIEAEDAVGICLTKYPDAIIVGQDHDLLQLPAEHYNPVKEVFISLTKEDALRNFNVQQLSGCSTDKVLGLKKGIGEAKAKKLLYGTPLLEQLHRILDLFIQEYGEYNGINNFNKNYILLKILRELDGFIFPNIIKIAQPEESVDEIEEKF